MSTEIRGLEVVTRIAQTFGLEAYLRDNGHRLWFHITPGGTVCEATHRSPLPHVDVWIEARDGQIYPLLWAHEQAGEGAEGAVGWTERIHDVTYEQCLVALHKAFEIAAGYEQEKPT